MAFKKNGTKRQVRSLGGDIAVLLFLVLLGSFMILPFVYSVAQSLKPMEELFIFPPRLFVSSPTFENFIDLFMRTNNMWVPLERYVFNSIWMTLLGTALNVMVASLAAFPLARFKFPGSVIYEKVIVLALLFVYEVTAIPQYVLMAGMGLIDTPWAIVLPAVASPLGLFLMKGFMTQMVPNELVEAATVDGAGKLTIFWRVAMPNVKPATLTLVILSFQALWNRDTSNLVFSEQLKNLPALFRQITSSGTIATSGMASAAAVLMMLPPIAVFLFSQKQMVETMAFSGIKG